MLIAGVAVYLLFGLAHGPDGNDVIILLGVAQVVKFLPHLFVSAELPGDAAG